MKDRFTTRFYSESIIFRHVSFVKKPIYMSQFLVQTMTWFNDNTLIQYWCPFTTTPLFNLSSSWHELTVFLNTFRRNWRYLAFAIILVDFWQRKSVFGFFKNSNICFLTKTYCVARNLHQCITSVFDDKSCFEAQIILNNSSFHSTLFHYSIIATVRLEIRLSFMQIHNLHTWILKYFLTSNQHLRIISRL